MATAVQQTTGIQTPPIQPNPSSAASSGAGAGHNNMQAVIDAGHQAWFARCEQFGEQAGQGATSLIAWMGDMVASAYRDEIDVDVAEEGVKRFQAAKAKRAAALGKRQQAIDGKADKVRNSEARKMIKLGKLAQFRGTNNGGLGVFNEALKVIGDSVHIKGELTKLVLKVATEQLRKPDAPLDADHIRQVLSPKEGEDPSEGEYLMKAKKNIELAAKAAGWDPHKRAALTSITARIEAIGFKTAQQRAAEQKAQDAAKKAKAKAKAQAKKKR